MLCPTCKATNEGSAAVCASCRTALKLVCPACGVPSFLTARFCAACGAAVRLEQAAPVERRQLSVLFCDLVGSTALSERLDPEDLHDLLSAYHAVCRDAVNRYQGHVAQFLGDGVMAYFGYPVAHEDDAVRAVHAGLVLTNAIQHVNNGIGRRLRADVRVRVGVHTGMAVVGEVGPGGVHDRLAVGDTVNLAARLQAVGEAGAVVASAATAKLVQGYFELQSLGTPWLKGFSQPVEIFRVLRETGARSPLEAAATLGLTPYVGRRDELGVLVQAWRDAKGGADRVVVVRGEAGIGKSRIIEAFRRSELDGSVSVLECFCSPLTESSALAPVIDMLLRLFDERTGQSTAASRLEALRSSVKGFSSFGPDALPLLATLLSLPGVDESPVASYSRTRRRARTLEVLHQWLACAAERVPTVVLFEDLHWADPTTLAFIELLISRPVGGRTLVCVTARPEFPVTWSAPHIRRVELGRLGAVEVEALATRVAGGRPLPAAVAQRVISRCEGIPLFVEEVTKAVLESGVLVDRDGVLALQGELPESVIPRTVEQSVVARFDRLGGSRFVAQLGAAIGREFSYALLGATSGLPERELRIHLGLLCGSGLVHGLGEAPHSAYAFKHALIQDAIYGTLLKKDRRTVHGRIFRELQERFPEIITAHPETAAHHAEEAGLRKEALPLRREAGVRALGRMSVTEAARHLSRALELLDALEEPARSSTELELQSLIAPVYMVVHGWGTREVERACERQRELAAERGDAGKYYTAVRGLFTCRHMRGELDAATELSRELLSLPLSRTDPLLRTLSLESAAYTRYCRGELAEALQHSAHALAVFDVEVERQAHTRLQGSAVNAIWSVHASVLWLTGFQDQVEPCLVLWNKQYETLTFAPSRLSKLLYGTLLLYFLRDWMRLLAWAREARTLAAVEEVPVWAAVSRIVIALGEVKSGGDAGKAAEEIHAGIAAYAATTARLQLTLFRCMEAEVLLAAGRPEAALATLAEAHAQADRDHERYMEAEIYRLDGDATAALGRRDQAAVLYRRALEVARASGARSHELRAAIAQHRLIGDARTRLELRAVYDRFVEGFGQVDLVEARSLLGIPDVRREGVRAAS